MDLLNLSHPHGTAWELLVVVAVIICGPLLMERLRIPGLIGLLAGGCLIGPSVLGVVSDTSGVLKELGEVGLLYLMFVAGLELDLAVFARFKRQAMIFSALTFVLPLGLGFAVGQIVDYSTAASLLLGSLFASYTLVVYPTVRNFGLSSNRAVAVTVGATVITDTLALIVLAGVSGSATGDSSGGELAVQIVLGLTVLTVVSFVVLPWLARQFFSGPGRARTVRYMFMLAALLGVGVLAEVVGIESIVGAFFAGLGLNRLVPNEGEFMERIEFFGSALFIPIFLVSVGTVIDPAVMIEPGTLGLAALFCLACVGGKLAAALACRPLFGFSSDEASVVFGLSVAQAAATLAATFVGLEIGLFTTATVNAVMIVIVVSLVLASLAAQRAGARIPRPEVDTSRLGRSVVVHLADPGSAPMLLALSCQLAEADSGVVHPTVVVEDGQADDLEQRVAALHAHVEALATDVTLHVHHDRAVNDGLRHASAGREASMLVVQAEAASWLPSLFDGPHRELVMSSPVPTAIVRPGADDGSKVVLALHSSQARQPTSAALNAAHLAVRLGRGRSVTVVAAHTLAPELAAILDGVEVIEADPAQWIRSGANGPVTVVVPGGRNGALGSARLARDAAIGGATVITVADRASTSRLAGGSRLSDLGVSTRTTGAAG